MTAFAFQRYRRTICVWLASLALIASVAHPSPALGHASLIASDPADGSVLATAPARLMLSFNEPVEPIVIRILDHDGVASAVTDIERDGGKLILKPASLLGEGAHIVSWRVSSADGHPVGGSLTFWIGAGKAAAPLPSSSENPWLRGAIWLARLVIDLGLFVGAGGAFFLAWIQPPSGSRPGAIGLAAAAGLVALLFSIGLQGLDILAAPAAALATPGPWIAALQGSFGRSAGIAAVALMLGLASLKRRGVAARAISLMALAGVGLALAATGHAASASPRALTVTSVFLHGVSLAFWLGALVPLVVLFARPRQQATAALLRFSRWIPAAVVALLASGILLAVVQLSRVDALWTSAYGRVLSAKLALVSALLVIGLWNRLHLTPRIAAGAVPARARLRTSIIAELLLTAVILGVVGLWRFTPPPRALAAGNDDFFTHLHAEKVMANVTVSPGHAGPVDITVVLETPDERPLEAGALEVTLSKPDAGIEGAVAQARRTGDGQWRVRMATPVAGQWTLALGVLISDFERINVAAPILIK